MEGRDAYPTTGDSDDWLFANRTCYPFTIEMGMEYVAPPAQLGPMFAGILPAMTYAVEMAAEPERAELPDWTVMAYMSGDNTLSAQVGRLAFEFNYWNPRAREFPILLMCEEAHAYIPRRAGTQYEGTRRSMERIAKEGRKYGVGLAVVSQRPHELSETVLAQCGNFICLRVTNPDDQQYIKELVPDAEAGLVDILSSLGRGEAMAMGEAVPLPTRFQFFRPNPVPNSGDVDFYTQWRDGPREIDVEVIANRWRRQGR